MKGMTPLELVLAFWTIKTATVIDRSNAVDMSEANCVVTSLAQAVEAVANRGQEGSA